MSLAVGDLVAEVIRNADPARQQKAIAKLQRLSPAGGAREAVVIPASVGFDSVLKGAAGSAPVRNFNLAPAGQAPSAQAPAVADQALQAAARQYETLYLQQMLQLALPAQQDEEGSNALAADLTRTQMASAMASQMAASGEFGIGQQIAQAQIKAAPEAVAMDPSLTVRGMASLEPKSGHESQISQVSAVVQQVPSANDPTQQDAPLQVFAAISSLWSRVEDVFESIGGTTRAVDRLERTR